MLGWFQALMPKEMRFFDLFERHARIVVAGAEALRGLLQGGETIEHYCRQIFERGTRGHRFQDWSNHGLRWGRRLDGRVAEIVGKDRTHKTNGCGTLVC